MNVGKGRNLYEGSIYNRYDGNGAVANKVPISHIHRMSGLVKDVAYFSVRVFPGFDMTVVYYTLISADRPRRHGCLVLGYWG
jgi:hypothetical protein